MPYKLYFRTPEGKVGSIPITKGTKIETLRDSIAQVLKVEPDLLTLSESPLSEFKQPAAVDAEYGELYSRIVGTENSDLWPAKWVAARSILTPDKEYDHAFTRLSYLLTDVEIANADGDKTKAVTHLAKRIWEKNADVADLLFNLDGIRRRFHKSIEGRNFGLDALQVPIQKCIEEMRELLD